MALLRQEESLIINELALQIGGGEVHWNTGPQETRHHPPHHSLIVIMRVGVVVVAVLVVLCLVAGSTCVSALFEPKATLAGSVVCS